MNTDTPQTARATPPHSLGGVRACILSVFGHALSKDERKLLARTNPFGVILMGRSCGSPDQVRALVEDIRGSTGRSTMIFIDQEGGRVARLKPPNWPVFPAAGRYGALAAEVGLDIAREAAWLGHRLMAAELAPLGVNADCAPDADLLIPGAHSIVGDRSFGADPQQVAALAGEALSALAAGGVAGVVKHIPGHGRAEVDSHEAMPVVRASREELEQDFAPFRALSGAAAMGMTAHLAYTALDGQTPATLSETIIRQVIREAIGFDGLLMTDDLGMNALGGSLKSRARRAVDAGVDVVLHCSGFIKEPEKVLEEMTEVAEACPELSGDALRRAHAAERAASPPEFFDRREGWRRLEQLLALGGAPGA
ncbi:MAG: beta-N-acetylhexosaminidase [Hyphomonadaceae bacterium]